MDSGGPWNYKEVPTLAGSPLTLVVLGLMSICISVPPLLEYPLRGSRSPAQPPRGYRDYEFIAE